MRALLLAGVVALGWTGAANAAPMVGDASFEAVNTGGQGFVYDPADTGGFTFTGYAGVTSNGSGFGFANAPDGTAVGFIQNYFGTNVGSISQTITGLTVGTTYTLSFDLAARPGPYAAEPIILVSTQNIQLLPGLSPVMLPQNLGTYSPTSTSFQAFNTNFSAVATSATLTFYGLANNVSQDLSTALDLVAVNAVGSATPIPEPASMALLGTGLLGMLVIRRQRRS